MLRSISWGQYIAFLLLSLSLFYIYLHRRFKLFQPFLDRMRRTRKITAPTPASTENPKPPAEQPNQPATPIQTSLFLLALLTATTAHAQTADGNAGINQANTLIRGYFATATQLMYAISAIIGLAGAIHVYIKMLRGHHDTQAAATAWFGACIFIAIVATVIQFFFGL